MRLGNLVKTGTNRLPMQLANNYSKINANGGQQNINSERERNLIIKVCDIILANDIQFPRFRSYSQNVAREMFLYSQKLAKVKRSLAFF